MKRTIRVALLLLLTCVLVSSVFAGSQLYCYDHDRMADYVSHEREISDYTCSQHADCTITREYEYDKYYCNYGHYIKGNETVFEFHSNPY